MSTILCDSNEYRPRTLAYVAGPYRATASATVDDNIRSAGAVALELARRDIFPITPHLNSAHFDTMAPEVPVELWLEGDLALLARCDVLVLAPRWQESLGTLEEVRYAGRLGIPVYDPNDGVEATDATLAAVPGLRLIRGWPETHPTLLRSPHQARTFAEIMGRMYRVHLNKNADYSPANILGTGRIGLTTRLWDKMARLMNLEGFRLELAGPAEYVGPKDAVNEPVEDAYMDLSVYGVIGLLLRQGAWGR